MDNFCFVQQDILDFNLLLNHGKRYKKNKKNFEETKNGARRCLRGAPISEVGAVVIQHRAEFKQRVELYKYYTKKIIEERWKCTSKT